MLLGVMVEGDEVRPVSLQAFRRPALAEGAQFGHVLVAEPLAVGLGVRGPHRTEAPPGFRLEPLGPLVLQVQNPMVLMPTSA